MKKVFIVIDYEKCDEGVEGEEIIAVFTSKKLADKFIKEYPGNTLYPSIIPNRTCLMLRGLCIPHS